VGSVGGMYGRKYVRARGRESYNVCFTAKRGDDIERHETKGEHTDTEAS